MTPWWRRKAWMVPAATAVVVAAVYLAVPSSVPPPAPSNDSRREAPAAPPPAAPAPAAAAALEAPEQDGATDVGNASAPAPTRKSSAERSKKTMPVPRTPLAEAAPPPAGAPGVMADSDARDLSSPVSLPQQAGTEVRAEAAAHAAPALGRSASVTLRTPESPAAQSLTVESADGLVRWRVTGPRVERTSDGGRTWFPERAPAITDITMGVAGSPTVCWLATRSGRVIRRTDEGEWHEVSPVPLIPLARIESASPGEARLVGTDGTAITTADGGLSWTREAPR